mmetsp:Transcript_2189/g.5819  ORF Transcript_2189/g.5819 Transcript_2189/m.5819 type:complete len:142 (+) Transcript_2189:858-1283(+)
MMKISVFKLATYYSYKYGAEKPKNLFQKTPIEACWNARNRPLFGWSQGEERELKSSRKHVFLRDRSDGLEKARIFHEALEELEGLPIDGLRCVKQEQQHLESESEPPPTMEHAWDDDSESSAYRQAYHDADELVRVCRVNQ